MNNADSGLLPIIKDRVKQIITVSEEAIVHAMRLVWERMKIIIEPSSAVAVAVVLESDLDVQGKRVGIILSGCFSGEYHAPGSEFRPSLTLIEPSCG